MEVQSTRRSRPERLHISAGSSRKSLKPKLVRFPGRKAEDKPQIQRKLRAGPKSGEKQNEASKARQKEKRTSKKLLGRTKQETHNGASKTKQGCRAKRLQQERREGRGRGKITRHDRTLPFPRANLLLYKHTHTRTHIRETGSKSV